MRSRASTIPASGLIFGGALILAIPFAALAQQNQPAWQPTHPSTDPNADHSQNDPKTNGSAPLGKGFTKPAGCTGERLVSQQLVALCSATPSGYFWRWWDFDVYVCTPDETPSFRRIQYTRETNIPCKKTMWEVTKKVGKSFGEDWTVNNNVFDSEKLEDPTNGTDDPPALGDGPRPDGRNSEATKAKDMAKAIDDKTNPKTETKTETHTGGGGGTGRQTEKRPRKEVKTTTKQRRAKIDNSQSTSGGGVSPDAAIGTAVGFGLGFGLGMGNRGGMMRDRGPRGDTMR